jgi:hypothetical protein
MARRILLGTFVLFLLVLVATSPARIVGDGAEYAAMSTAVAELRSPSPHAHLHFWLYPALAAPFVRLAGAAGLSPLHGFTAVNLALLALACWVVSGRVNWAATLLLVAGPIIWWVDKAHTEAFTFSLLAIAFALAGVAPWWTFVALGLASTQNPPIALAMPLVLALALRSRAVRGDRRLWFGVAGGIALALLAPLYDLLTEGVLFPLASTTHREIPTIGELGAVLWDPNLGLLAQFPIVPLVLVAAVAGLVRKAPSRLRDPELGVALATAAIFVWVFAHSANFNHGATPGMSRYALWLIPLSIPLLRQLDVTFGRGAVRWIVPVTALSVAWSLVAFHPGQPQAYGTPSVLAHVIWTHHPTWNDPLPEVFAERLNGADIRTLPVSTAGCEKILLGGNAEGRGVWPIPCRPAEVPARCLRPRALCYANQAGAGYVFAAVAERRHLVFPIDEGAVWPPAAEGAATRLLDDLGWAGMRIVQTGQDGAMLRAFRAARGVRALQAPDRLFIVVRLASPGGTLALRLPGPMTGSIVDLESGRALESVVRAGPAWAMTELRLPQSTTPLALVLRTH